MNEGLKKQYKHIHSSIWNNYPNICMTAGGRVFQTDAIKMEPHLILCVSGEFSWFGISAHEGLLCEFISETSSPSRTRDFFFFFFPLPTSRVVSATLLHPAQFQRLLLGVLFSALVIT